MLVLLSSAPVSVLGRWLSSRLPRCPSPAFAMARVAVMVAARFWHGSGAGLVGKPVALEVHRDVHHPRHHRAVWISQRLF